MSHIHVGRDGSQFGPYSEALARSLYAQGTITADDLVWREGFESWRPASAVFGWTEVGNEAKLIGSPAAKSTLSTATPEPNTGKQVLWMEHPTTQEVRRAPWGFSWTTLVFGPIVPLVRRDMPGFWVSLPLTLITAGWTNVLFAFLGNKQYIKRLVASGYHATAVETGSLEAVSRALEFQLPIAAGVISTGSGALKPEAQRAANSVSKVRMTWITVGLVPFVALGVFNPTKYAANPLAKYAAGPLSGTSWQCGRAVKHFYAAGEFLEEYPGDPTAQTPLLRWATRTTGSYTVKKGLLVIRMDNTQVTSASPSDMQLAIALNNGSHGILVNHHDFEVNDNILTMKMISRSYNGQAKPLPPNLKTFSCSRVS